MKLYNALVKKNNEGKIEDIILRQEGFSKMAFLFSTFWFLYHGMRKEFFVLLVANIVFAFSEKVCVLSGFDEFCLEISFFFVIALNANYWLTDHLKKKGYEFVGLVFANDIANAKMRFAENLKADNMLDLVDLKYTKASLS